MNDIVKNIDLIITSDKYRKLDSVFHRPYAAIDWNDKNEQIE